MQMSRGIIQMADQYTSLSSSYCRRARHTLHIACSQTEHDFGMQITRKGLRYPEKCSYAHSSFLFAVLTHYTINVYQPNAITAFELHQFLASDDEGSKSEMSKSRLKHVISDTVLQLGYVLSTCFFVAAFFSIIRWALRQANVEVPRVFALTYWVSSCAGPILLPLLPLTFKSF